MKKMNFVFKHTKKHWYKFLILFVATIVATFISSVYPYVLGKLVDESVYGKDIYLFFKWAIIYAVAYIIAQVIYFVQNIAWAKLMTGFVFDIRKELFNKLMSVKARFLINTKTGDIVNRINSDADSVLDLIHQDVFYLVATIVELISSLYFVCKISYIVAAYCVIATPVVFLLTKHMSKKNKKHEKKIIEQQSLLTSRTFEFLNGYLDIKILAMPYKIIQHLLSILKMFYNEKIKLDKWNILSSGIVNGLNLFSTLLVYYLSIILIKNGYLTIGEFVACANYISRITKKYSSINKRVTSIKVKSINLERINEVLDEESEELEDHDLDHALQCITNDSYVSFNNVTFSYEKNNNVLNNLTFDIKQGEKVALVGESGSGKSTIINLICGFYDVKSGEIKVGNYYIGSGNLSKIRSHIGIVHQDILLFNDTIRYNLSFANDSISDDELWKALSEANLVEFIRGLPEQLDTKIGYGGIQLSGG